MKSRTIIFVIIILLVIAGGIGLTRKNTTSGNVQGDKIDIAPARSTREINTSFTFPLRDSANKEAGTFSYTIENAELRDEIVVNGQKATAIQGRIFLVINIKLNNSGNSAIRINTRDFVRLSVNGKPDLLAADIHNDPVEIQPISTKYSRLGFPINESDKQLQLHVGEINGKKQTIDIQF